MHIHQVSVNYLPEQDRILARINTTAGEEMRLWFTRRLTMGMWTLMRKVVADQVAQLQATAPERAMPISAADPATRQMMAEFKKAESIQSADFQTPFKEQPAALPLGTEPLLVTELNLTPRPSGQLEVNFQEKLPGQPNVRAFQMQLQQSLVHGFMHLLEGAINQSHWNQTSDALQSLAASADEAADTEPLPLDRPKYLN